MTTYWAQMLHFYQPPTQTHAILERVVRESYRPVVAVLLANPGARVGINMNAVLSQMLDEHGFGDVIEGLRTLGARGQIEFIGSGRYHPILPLIGDRERRRSISGNAMVNRRLFGNAYRPRGFFPPEMAYGQSIDGAVEQHHAWIALSGVACPEGWPVDRVHRVEGSQRLQVLFRDDVRSNRISFRETNAAHFLSDLGALTDDGADRYVFTAMDAETYGHHIKGWETEFLAAVYAGIAADGGRRVIASLPSEVVARFPEGDPVRPRASSWSTLPADIATGDPYPLWRSPGNPIHQLQWDYAGHAMALAAAARRAGRQDREARRYADLADETLGPALHSCQFWWASRRPWWDVMMMVRGGSLLGATLSFAARAVSLGTLDDASREHAQWRLAAAAECRRQLEHAWATEAGP
jgi:hypothetical protein